ncbi:MAG TPA: VWA domain-containing protein [Terriglobales bacterium]|nr:VWA domain-containing protein [Terriglobales bacterium]
MKRIPQVLRAASYELRAISGRFSSWLEARGSKLTARLIVCAFFAAASGRLLAEEPETTIKVDVKLVNVFVTVTDAHGSPVANLQKENFLLKEDGKEQKIAIFDKESALPLSIALSVDTSLSTRKDLALELTSARKFAHAIVRPQDGLAVYKFSEEVSLMVPFTSDLKKIDAGIDQVRIGAATALYDAVYLGSHALSRRQGRKVMVVITDGGDTMSQVNYKEALRAAQEAEAIIYSIIIVPIEADAGRDTGGEHALIQISSDTGGKYYYAKSLAQLDDAFRQISDELRTQYLLAYYPSQRYSNSDFRQLKVDLTNAPAGGPYQSHYRAGYYTHKGTF